MVIVMKNLLCFDTTQFSKILQSRSDVEKFFKQSHRKGNVHSAVVVKGQTTQESKKKVSLLW